MKRLTDLEMDQLDEFLSSFDNGSLFAAMAAAALAELRSLRLSDSDRDDLHAVLRWVRREIAEADPSVVRPPWVDRGIIVLARLANGGPHEAE